jgi:hypothetical protein
MCGLLKEIAWKKSFDEIPSAIYLGNPLKGVFTD